MGADGTAYVRCIAALHGFRRDRGLPASFEVTVPEGGVAARALAAEIGLPVDRIEGLFLNNRIAGIDAIVRAGDRVVFVPAGTPASHPSFFGPFVTRE